MKLPDLDSRGNVAMLTAFALPIILGVTGLAVDFGNAVRTRSHLQGALDAAVLAAASSGRPCSKPASAPTTAPASRTRPASV